MSQGNPWSGLLMTIVGVWLVVQSIAGDLPRRIISWGQANTTADGGD